MSARDLFALWAAGTLVARFTRSWAGMDTEAIALLIDDLAAARIQLRVEGGALCHRAPPDALTPERRALLDAHREEIREFIRVRSHAGVRPPHVPGAQAVWAPTPVQASILRWAATLMRDMRTMPVLDPAVAQAALNELIARHDALRTRYAKDEEGRYWAVTEQRVSVFIEHVDITTLSADAQADRLREITWSLLHTPFDMEAGPLLRMGLVRAGEHHMLSLLATCHTIFDRISRDVFFREFRQLYRSIDSGAAPALSPDPPQFRDYAQQLNERLNGEPGYEDFLYIWNRVLARELDFPRSAMLRASVVNRDFTPVASAQRATSLIRYRSIDARQFASLRNLVRGERVTAFAAALAATGIALRSCARSQDAFVWLVQSARTTAQMADLIGCVAIHSFFPMRFSNEQTFSEVLRWVWQTHLEDMKHLVPAQSLEPISKRAYESGVFIGTELNYMLASPPAPPPGTLGGGATRNFSTPIEEDGSVFPLRVCFFESQSGLTWSVRHKSALLEEEMAERVSSLIGEILVQMIQDVGATLTRVRDSVKPSLRWSR